MDIFSNWVRRYLSDPEAIVLLSALLLGIAVIMTMGHMLAPVFASVIIAYLLAWGVHFLERCKVPHSLSVIVVYIAFLAVFIFSLVGILPLLWKQLSNFTNELPNMLNRGQELLIHLPEQYPAYISTEQLNNLIVESKGWLSKFGQLALSATLASIPGLVVIIVYLVLVPLLVYFFLMDSKPITGWLLQYFPQRRRLAQQVWEELQEAIGNYVRGKIIELILVWIVCYIVFKIMGLPYSMLLAAGVGVSVIIPYIGAVLATVPVVVVAALQWGWSAQFAYLMIAYTVIIVLDANLLVPILFAETVKLHPVAIIVAVLVFGGIWGFWGVFFAIPLASLVKAVLKAWPRSQEQMITVNE